MKEIPLTQGLVALVDDADYEYLSRHRWHAHRSKNAFYASRIVNRRTVTMHRVILCAPPDMHVDHISGDGLDNRRVNLRLATLAQNSRNRGLNKNSKSGLKGVCWHISHERWQAHIRANGRRKHIGYFSTPVDAHAAYCAAAKELHKEFARFA